MDTKTFFENFETIANAPGGIARLRELILNLAVRGKLVPQRIGEKSISVAAADGKYEIPNSWKWVKISTVSDFVNGFAFKSEEYIEDGIGVVRMSDLKLGQIATQGMKRVPSKYLTILDENLHISPGDLVIGMSGSIGKPCFNFTDETFLLNQRVGKFIPHSVEKKYLAIVLQTLENSFLEMSAGSGIKNLSTKQIKDAELPLPPQNEQKRIAAKVDELMALCDQLELAQQQRDLLRTSARNSAIDSISTASTAEELSAAWKRINQNWTTFADTPESISSLRSLILDLAVRGNIIVADAAAYQTFVDVDLEKLKLEEDKLWTLNTALPEPAHGWSRVPMARLGKWGSGGTPTASRKEFYSNGTIPWAVIGDLNNSVMTTTESLITRKALESSSAKMVPVGAVLVAMYGASIGKSAISGIECCTNQAIAHCVVDEDVIMPSYMFLVIKSLKKHLMEMGKGAAQPNISQSVLKHLVIDIPPLKIQEEVIVRTDELIDLCDQLEASLALKVAHEETIAKTLGRLEAA